MLRRKKAQPTAQPQRNETLDFEENRPLKQRIYGSVITRIWKNESITGEISYTFSQNRIYERYGEERLAKSFRPSDYPDVIRGCQWIAGFAKVPAQDKSPASTRPELRVHRTQTRRTGGQ
ncbi:hypothetical protein Poly59_23200 [Rubripirellula reticaptiva]|uniref:Uncharacterized protein n=1 Tax=Rubripirellula reticaptiva TaxID=2528013 RepID=A0A5C6F6J6_9BACT|nr:hypothetical protein Poly59_23200 [Rubripirellula reticaptiva]